MIESVTSVSNLYPRHVAQAASCDGPSQNQYDPHVSVRSQSQLIPVHDEEGFGSITARAIDSTIAKLGLDREVVSVAVTPLTYGYPNGGHIGAVGISRTVCVIVTVVYREA